MLIYSSRNEVIIYVKVPYLYVWSLNVRKLKRNLVTLKIKYTTDEVSLKYIEYVQNDFNKVLRVTYNRICENSEYTTKELTAFQSKLNNVDGCKSHLKSSSIYKSREIYIVSRKSNPQKAIFGGRKNFINRCQSKISHEEFAKKRVFPIHSIGQCNCHGNRLFKIVDYHTVIFKPDRRHHIQLNLRNIGKNREKQLLKLIELQNTNCIPITYELDLEYVYITFDNSIFENHRYSVRTDRTMQIDVNPNYIGWSVTDWKQDYNFHLVASGMFSLKPLNDYENGLSVSSDSKESKYVSNKRKHEVIEIAKELFRLCAHYRCEVFSMEDLSMKSTNIDRGKKFNRLVNGQWCRNLLSQQIRKRILSSSTNLVEIQPRYSSIVGNLVNRRLELPDPVLASIEIGRRGHEFSCQYIFKRRQQEKTVVLPKIETVKKSITQSLEELGIDVPEFNDWVELWSVVKKSKVKYRFPLLSKYESSHFSKNYKRRYQIIYEFQKIQ